MPELHAASEGMLKWLKAPTLPRPFVLDLLDFVLGNSAAVFRSGSAYIAQTAHDYVASSNAHMPCTCMPMHILVHGFCSFVLYYVSLVNLNIELVLACLQHAECLR